MNLSSKVRIIVILLSLTPLTGCKKDHLFDCFKSTGKSITESRPVGAFEEINLTDNVDLVFRPATEYSITVTAGDNLIDGIITELDGNTLYIRNENRCNWMRSFSNKYTVEVSMPVLNRIYYDGSGDITFADTLRNDNFLFDCFNGSGTINFLFNNPSIHLNNHIGRTDMHIKGYSGDTKIYVNDVGTFEGDDFLTPVAYVRNRSTGNCRIRVTGELSYEILHTGNIYYSGNPAIVYQSVTGSGKLIPY